MKTQSTNDDFYTGLQYLPKSQYPFPDFTHPICKTEGRILELGIDKEYAFHSEEAREKHKKHHL
ncbi:hypothetical protein ACN9MN_01890 [Chryseobacterium sp. S-02]|uniref:hypothetical protein n=1 Tax=Chryseobacterium sp. S-02 TaxID=3404064 RepID=UPI003CF42792